MLATVGGALPSYVAIWSVPVGRSVRGAEHTHHWRSQVFQAAPEVVEFDVWSECDHEVAAVRAEVIEPGGRAVLSEFTIEPPGGRVESGGYVGLGNYPQRFVGAAPLINGEPYSVVWYAKRLPSSPWVEIARQHFTTQVPNQRLVQTRA